MSKVNSSTRASQISEAAQKAYDSFLKSKEILNQALKGKGINPEKAKQKAAHITPNKAGIREGLNKADALLGAALMKLVSSKTQKNEGSNKTTQNLMRKQRMKI